MNFGVHAALRRGGAHYIDFHLPYAVITIGDVDRVEYPSDWWASAKDISTGVRYGDGSNQ